MRYTAVKASTIKRRRLWESSGSSSELSASRTGLFLAGSRAVRGTHPLAGWVSLLLGDYLHSDARTQARGRLNNEPTLRGHLDGGAKADGVVGERHRVADSTTWRAF